jgi:hypothetical protein
LRVVAARSASSQFVCVALMAGEFESRTMKCASPWSNEAALLLPAGAFRGRAKYLDLDEPAQLPRRRRSSRGS